MPLLEKVEHRESGLEGKTEDGKWVHLTTPRIYATLGEPKQPTIAAINQIKEMARKKRNEYYQIGNLMEYINAENWCVSRCA